VALMRSVSADRVQKTGNNCRRVGEFLFVSVWPAGPTADCRHPAALRGRAAAEAVRLGSESTRVDVSGRDVVATLSRASTLGSSLKAMLQAAAGSLS
jgi:hypothetical protein